VRGQQPKSDELSTRVAQLEKRVAELEKIIKQMQAQAKESPRTTAETRLPGTWVIADDDRKLEGVFTDLKLKADGTGKGVINFPDRQWDNMKYEVVGKQLQFREQRGSLTYSVTARLRSVRADELVLEYKIGEKLRQVRYTREK
jgi:hypothetical protein